MSLNLENEETKRLARELARRTGESLTEAVTRALQERLERHQESAPRNSRLERIIEIVERTAPHMRNNRSGESLVSELYDSETGLPK